MATRCRSIARSDKGCKLALDRASWIGQDSWVSKTSTAGAVSVPRRIVDRAVELYAAGDDRSAAFVGSVRELMARRAVTEANLETAAALWVRVANRVDSRARILPNRTPGGQFRAA